jgi:penicillin amidase
MTASTTARRLLLPLLFVVAVAVVVGADAQAPAPAVPPAAETEAGLRAMAAAALSQTSGEVRLRGLRAPVEILRDRWGVPHIYAKNTHDLFFAQGFVAAQDRLWQLDLWRRIAEGKLAEIVGPSAVDRDTFARLVRYRGDMEAEWKAYRPDARAIVEAFVAGVNAQIAVATFSPGKLPIEFQLTGTRPQPWTPEVVIGRMAGYVMTRNARSEVQRAKLVRAAGAVRAPLFLSLDPDTTLAVPDGLDLGDISDEILALATGVSESVRFPGTLTNPGAAPSAASAECGVAGAGCAAFPADGEGLALDEIGSNDWVVSGRMTATGKPLLANDPHRALMLPSLRYTVHLNAPGWNVIGAGEPALPGIAAGHNDRVAFGFTIVGIDQQDLYVEQLDPADHGRYRYRGGWEPLRVERERIAVRGEAPREVALRFTRHGPVLHVDEARHRAYALRWVGAEPGSAGYLRSLALNTVSNWAEFREAVAGWKIPSENLIYADVDGNIGWIAGGLAPVRPNWNGLLPVPGQDGKYEWSGFLGVDRLPQSYNPSSGFIATANHNILPAGYQPVLGFEFSSPFRFARILEVLASGRDTGRKFTVQDFERLQHDEQSVVARAVCEALRRSLALRDTQASRIGSTDRRDQEETSRAAKLLTSWDGTLSSSSAAAALYETWLPRLTRALAEKGTASEDRPLAPSAIGSERLLAMLAESRLAEAPRYLDAWVDGTPRLGSSRRPACGSDAECGRMRTMLIDVLTGPTLLEAYRDVRTRLGDETDWQWGRIHRAAFEHPLAGSAARKAVLNTGDAARGGDSTTPNATGTGPRQTAGASFREVIDVANWDDSTTVNVPGLSGQPGSPHYADLLPLWAEGRYHALPFSRAAVEAATAQRLTLLPVR